MGANRRIGNDAVSGMRTCLVIKFGWIKPYDEHLVQP